MLILGRLSKNEKLLIIQRNMKKVFLFGVITLLLFPAIVQAQYLRNSYFMEGSSTRMQLNPAFQPTRGYINLPVIGSLNAEVSSNSLGTQDIINIFDSDGDFYNNDSFYKKLKTNNKLSVNLNTDVVSFGFYKGKGFWSFNIGARINADAAIPKTMFDYLRAVNNENYNNSFHIANEKLHLNAYTEIGAGYSRSINQRLSVGAKVKVLLGAANLNLDVKNIDIKLTEAGYDSNVEINSNAQMQISGKGIDLDEENGEISDINYNGFGFGGYGAGIDLGACYKLTDHLTLSASILDLGFISWSKKNTTIAESKQHETIDATNASEDVLDFDLFGLRKVESKSRTTSLNPTLAVGAEYALLNNKLGLGVLSTTRFGQLRTYPELTISATARPNSLINATLSYSILQGLDTFGFALKLGPFMIGTDYMFLGNNTKHVNAFIGLSIPLGKKQKI